jgi:hypothetical protein
LFETEKIEFAYPTQTLFVSNLNQEKNDHLNNGSDNNGNAAANPAKKEAAQ